MVIKKVLKFIDKIKQQPRNKLSVIVGVKSESTLIGRQKILSLKKIGKKKREGIKISRIKNIN